LSEIKEYVKAGHFPAGSMGPKVDAVVQFAEGTGNRGIICQLDDIQKAVEGDDGTEISQ
jgi:carbamate kinase